MITAIVQLYPVKFLFGFISTASTKAREYLYVENDASQYRIDEKKALPKLMHLA
jgi:hypothetical protein